MEINTKLLDVAAETQAEIQMQAEIQIQMQAEIKIQIQVQIQMWWQMEKGDGVAQEQTRSGQKTQLFSFSQFCAKIL